MGAGLATGLAGIAALFALIALRIPIAFAMILVGAGGIAALSGTGVLLNQLKTLAFGQFAIYDLSVVPMFVLMGALATRAGLSDALFRAARAWLGWARGGVAMAAIVGCAGFGAVCGSSLATASTMGRVALPELRRARYSGALATGTLAAGGVLGILIPPSVVLVLYAVQVEADIATLFIAALLPGLLATLLFLATIALYVRLRPEAGPKGARADRAERRAASLGALPVALIFTLVIGGIYGGLFTPTPAAAIGVALVLAYGIARRRIAPPALRAALLETAATTGMIYLILLGAELLKIFMSRGGVPQATADWLAGSGLPPLAVLVLLLAALLLLGCLMDSLSMILLAVPFFWPVLVSLNGGLFVSPAESGFGMETEDLKIWFGILALITVELGLITPPVGMNVFIIAGLAPDTPMRETFLGVLPFLAAELLRVALILALPALVLWLPAMLRG